MYVVQKGFILSSGKNQGPLTERNTWVTFSGDGIETPRYQASSVSMYNVTFVVRVEYNRSVQHQCVTLRSTRNGTARVFSKRYLARTQTDPLRNAYRSSERRRNVIGPTALDPEPTLRSVTHVWNVSVITLLDLKCFGTSQVAFSIDRFVRAGQTG